MMLTICIQENCPFIPECKRAEYHYDSASVYQSYDKFTPTSDAFGVSTCDYFIHKDKIRMFDGTKD